ncbi:transporter protein [Legionella lansingensis]|uniref:Transporter protein n=1 Tax=Legionella lansingensis TaxID=45067 RepID=A0A0W0VLK7_9GAMM|nr:DUF6691 family protein [Legionella lansingensis]KTD20986.1 hypothetical protein Llan_1716 [Legionella lansingensis]SNV44778.1 transporter protein [Legionella lansingensis]
MYSLMAFLTGILFGIGLTISNMINPNKVLNFLDVTGAWDPTLLMVMVAAVVTTFLGYQIIQKRKKPIFAETFYFPEKKKIIDKNLLIGSAIFGIGWGMAGYCPGPSITALATFNFDPLYFVIGMISGSLVYYWLFLRR